MSQHLVIRGGGYKYYDEVSFLRGISIMAIVIMHLAQGWLTFLPEWVIKAASLGGSGVHVFFFCSGFGLYQSYLKEPVGIKIFFRKRFNKVFLPYIAVVIISSFIPEVTFDGDRLRGLLSHIFLYKMFIPKYETSFGIHWWFISTLFQLYVLFLPLTVLKRKTSSISLFIITCMHNCSFCLS